MPLANIASVPLPRIEYGVKEFAEMIGISAGTLQKPKYYRRYGGKKRGGRIIFSASAAQAIAEGKR